MTATHPLDWIRSVEASLVKLDEKPQFGLPAPLDWQKLEQEIQNTLGVAQVKLKHEVKGWVTADQVFAEMPEKPTALAVKWSPVAPSMFFVTDAPGLKELMAALFQSDEAASYFSDSEYAQGFAHYFAAEMLHVLQRQQFAAPLTPRLQEDSTRIREWIGDQACFVIDVNLSLHEKNFWGRILLPENFRKEWKKYFAHLGPPPLTEEMKEKIMVEISLEMGYSRLKLEDWKRVKNGDFIVLDHCSYDPLERKGALVMTLKQKPIFRGRLKDGGIKITNYPVYEEVSDAMEDEPFDKDFDSEDEDLYGDLDDDTDFEEEDEDIFAGLESKKASPPTNGNTSEEEKKVTAELEPAGSAPTLTAEEFPIHLTVEVGRIHMTAGALMQLAPGNLLELNVSPEQGVDLVVNGKKVGRGELIRMGDILGVRILAL